VNGETIYQVYHFVTVNLLKSCEIFHNKYYILLN
jgi:hypothetical protein